MIHGAAAASSGAVNIAERSVPVLAQCRVFRVQARRWLAAAPLARRILLLVVLAALPSLLVLVQNDIYLRQSRYDEAKTRALDAARHTSAEFDRVLEGT